MTLRFNQHFTIVISAPRGALGRPLATLLHYVCNPSDATWDADKFAPGQFEFSQAERLAYRDKDLNELQLVLPMKSAGSPQVVSSRLSVPTLNSVFTDAVFISISAPESAKSQLGYNLLREELAHDTELVALQEDLSAVEQLMFKTSYDWTEEMRDPLHMDKPHVQLLCAYLGKMRTNIDSIGNSNTDPDADKVLNLTYEEISAKGTTQLKYKLLEFLQPWAVFNPDVFEQHWSNYTQALNVFHV